MFFLLRSLFTALTLAILVWLAWLAWTPPKHADNAPTARVELPGAESDGLWRVVTKKLVWKKAADGMRDRFVEEGLEPILIRHREPIDLHAFDDRRTFGSIKKARSIQAEWQKNKVEAEVVQDNGIYRISLGRFFLTSYAEQMQDRLQRLGKPYSYEKRSIEIPTFRFTFPPLPKEDAEQLWRFVQNLGIADPALVEEQRFLMLYKDALPAD